MKGDRVYLSFGRVVQQEVNLLRISLRISLIDSSSGIYYESFSYPLYFPVIWFPQICYCCISQLFHWMFCAIATSRACRFGNFSEKRRTCWSFFYLFDCIFHQPSARTIDRLVKLGISCKTAISGKKQFTENYIAKKLCFSLKIVTSNNLF